MGNKKKHSSRPTPALCKKHDQQTIDCYSRKLDQQFQITLECSSVRLPSRLLSSTRLNSKSDCINAAVFWLRQSLTRKYRQAKLWALQSNLLEVKCQAVS
jgi:hypothetical protein